MVLFGIVKKFDRSVRKNMIFINFVKQSNANFRRSGKSSEICDRQQN